MDSPLISPTHSLSKTPDTDLYFSLPAPQRSSPARPLSKTPIDFHSRSTSSSPSLNPNFIFPRVEGTIVSPCRSEGSSATVIHSGSTPYTQQHNPQIAFRLPTVGEASSKKRDAIYGDAVPNSSGTQNKKSHEEVMKMRAARAAAYKDGADAANFAANELRDQEYGGDRSRIPESSAYYSTIQEQNAFPKCSRQIPPELRYDCDLVIEMRAQITIQNQLITEQKIKIAVLENDLKHSDKSRQDAVQSSLLITKFLGSSLSVSDSGEEKDREIQMLKRENGILWKRLENREVRDLERKIERDLSMSENEASAMVNTHREDRRRRESNAAGIAKVVSAEARGQHRFDTDQRPSLNIVTHFPVAQPTSKTFSPENRADALKGLKEPSSSRGANLPTSPVIAAALDGENPSPLCISELGVEENFKPSSKFVDIGIRSLEDVFEGKGYPPPILSNEHVEGGIPKLLDEEGPGIDIEIQQKIEELNKLSNLPTPGVLKTGFDLTGSFIGAGYDLNSRGATNQYVPRHATRDYNRFAPYSRGGASSANFDESLAEFSAYVDIPDLSQSSTLWNSSEERDGAINLHRQIDGSKYCPGFFHHGINYKPSKEDTNYFRTVIIGGVPEFTELREVLARIRGGDIVSVVLMDTLKLLGSMSAMVQFVNEGSAQKYIEYVTENKVTIEDDGPAITATLVPTATYPNSRRDKSSQKQTRNLAIPDFPRHLSLNKLERDLEARDGHQVAALVEFFLSSRNTLHIEFSSVNRAVSIFWFFCRRMFHGLEVCFEPDPCAGSVGELTWDIPPRPPLLPREAVSFSSNDDSDRPVAQRKQLVLLTNQQIIIPSFSGDTLQSGSWADEVNDEFDSSDSAHASQASTRDSEERLKPTNEGLNDTTSTQLRRPVGLAGSIYAPTIRKNNGSHAERSFLSLSIVPEESVVHSIPLTPQNPNATPNQSRARSAPRVNLASLLAPSDTVTEDNTSGKAKVSSTLLLGDIDIDRDGGRVFELTDEERLQVAAAHASLFGLKAELLGEQHPAVFKGTEKTCTDGETTFLYDVESKSAARCSSEERTRFETPLKKCHAHVYRAGSPNDADVESGADGAAKMNQGVCAGKGKEGADDILSAGLVMTSKTYPEKDSFVRGRALVESEDPFGCSGTKNPIWPRAFKSQGFTVINPDEILLDLADEPETDDVKVPKDDSHNEGIGSGVSDYVAQD